jgi:hypothetical protein
LNSTRLKDGLARFIGLLRLSGRSLCGADFEAVEALDI